MTERTTCCIVGCGPAGAVLGLILARAGIGVLVLEKHADFFRDFRGDTVHPPTLRVLDDLGLVDRYFELPVQKVRMMKIVSDRGVLPFADFSNGTGKFPFVTYVPQWDFLTMLTQEADRYPTFELRMRAEAVGVIEENRRVVGVRYRTPDGDGTRQIRAELTVAADGRHSVIRHSVGLRPKDFGAAMDVLWFRVPRIPSDPDETFVRLTPGYVFPMINRGSYWQMAYVVPKGVYEKLRRHDIAALRAMIRRVLPFLGDRVEEITSWDQIGFLEVQVNRLKTWHRPGLLCIGDAAHASSPVAGFGANLAVQDAVAAANVIAEPLRRGRISSARLAKVKRRRQIPTSLTHAIQALAQRDIVEIPDPLTSERLDALPTELDLDRVVDLPLPLMSRGFRRLARRVMTEGLRSARVRVPAHDW